MTTGADGPLRTTGSLTMIDLRVIPRSPKNVVGGVREQRLLVRVTAPPVDDAANAAVVAAVAEALDVPRSRVTLTTGHASRNKSVVVVGLTVADVRQRLGPARLGA